ncbi:MAG: xanthine dehydrogenase family protein molybdopterin-binding subunit [Acetobacteraceae bacterium]|nr:xanthine dehydrogenase family protein molybdopterin-binding subunit [Acetobacteraceae bacterium]
MIVGQSTDRLDGRLKVTGRARYAAEVKPPNMVHAVLVQSTVAAGNVAGIDATAAQTMPGVLRIITSANAEKLNLTGAKVLQSMLQNNDIFYNGQHVAIVVAVTLQQAQAAASRVRVRYTPTHAATMMDAALNQATLPTNFRDGKVEPDTRTGNPQAAMATAPVRIEQTYTTPIEHHNPMEAHATIASWDRDRLTVWTATQGISGAQESLASLFGLAKANVVVICPFVGGGFGCKGQTWPPTALAAMAARSVNRPVKLEVTRQQMFTSNGYRPRTVQSLKLAANQDGKLLAVQHDSLTQTSRPEVGEFAEPSGLAARMLYACPNIATSHRVVGINQGLPTFMRGPGEASGMFALESAMDELAVQLRMDPLALRLANYASEDATSGKPYASKGLRECYAKGAAAFGWQKRDAAPGSMRDGRVLIGLGMATATYPTVRMAASAQVRMMPDGTVLVRSGTQDIGTGTYTIMAQIAADELGLPLGRVRVELGDSRLPPAPISGGSMTTASVLPAVHAAAIQLRHRLLTLALAQAPAAWGTPAVKDLRLQDGLIVGPGGQVSAGDVVARQNVPFIDATVDIAPNAASKDFSCHAFGAQFAEVRIDPDLRTVKISRWVGAYDCGRVINPQTARSQLIGGIVFGIGMALMEETRVDAATGRTINANISEYLVPVNADIPVIETIFVEAPDLVTTELGVKGIGELPMVGVAAAIANAIYHATGTRVRDLPIRLDNLLA